MRCETLTHAKRGKWGALQPLPKEGSRIRWIYDRLMENKGQPIPLKLNASGDSRRMQSLQDFYGLDIRRLQSGNSRTGRSSLYVAAGEWFGRVYVDYIAEHLSHSSVARLPADKAATVQEPPSVSVAAAPFSFPAMPSGETAPAFDSLTGSSSGADNSARIA